jgi:hypothetical protein
MPSTSIVIQPHKAYKTRIYNLQQSVHSKMHIRNVEGKECINNGILQISVMENGMAILGIKGTRRKCVNA